MPTLTIDYRDDAERLALEQAIAYVTHLRAVAQTAPDGTVLDACDTLALADGRAQQQAESGRQALLADGYAGVTHWVGQLAGQVPPGGDGAALGGVLNNFCGHQGRLNYALRLRRGQAIGSGLVEGSIKQLLNQRLKQTGARWRVEHVGPLVELGALAAGPEWQPFREDN
jgi:hypothetical protein